MSDIKEIYRSAAGKIQVSPETLLRVQAAMQEAQKETETGVSSVQENEVEIKKWYQRPMFRRNAGLVAACLCVMILGFGVFRISQIRMGGATDKAASSETSAAAEQAVIDGDAEMAKDEVIPEDKAGSIETNGTSGEAATSAEIRPETAEQKSEETAENAVDEKMPSEAVERLLAGDCEGDYDVKYLTKEDILSVERLEVTAENGTKGVVYEFICKVNEAMRAAYPDAPETIIFTVSE